MTFHHLIAIQRASDELIYHKGTLSSWYCLPSTIRPTDRMARFDSSSRCSLFCPFSWKKIMFFHHEMGFTMDAISWWSAERVTSWLDHCKGALWLCDKTSITAYFQIKIFVLDASKNRWPLMALADWSLREVSSAGHLAFLCDTLLVFPPVIFPGCSAISSAVFSCVTKIFNAFKGLHCYIWLYWTRSSSTFAYFSRIFVSKSTCRFSLGSFGASIGDFPRSFWL